MMSGLFLVRREACEQCGGRGDVTGGGFFCCGCDGKGHIDSLSALTPRQEALLEIAPAVAALLRACLDHARQTGGPTGSICAALAFLDGGVVE